MIKSTLLALAAFAAFSGIRATAFVSTPPLNDDFAHAFDLTSGSSTVDGTLATAQPGEPDHLTFGGATQPAHSLWWKFTPTFCGYVQIDTAGSAYDTVMSVYTGNTLTSLTRIAQDDESGNSLSSHASLIKLAVTKGVVYRIAVDGFSAATTGSTTLNISYLRINVAQTYQMALLGSSQQADNGLLSFTTSPSGAVTGSLRLGGSATFGFTGAIDVNGHMLASIYRPNFPAVSMDIVVGAVLNGTVYGSATGSIKVGEMTYSVLAHPAINYTTTSPCPRAGRHVQAIQNSGAVGFGVSSFIVSSTGAVTTTGTLADGSAFSFSSRVLDDSGSINGDISTRGAYCYHLPMYGGAGQITGNAAFNALDTPTSVTGTMQWFRPAPKPGTAFLPQSINGSVVNTFGNKYTPPAPGHRVAAAFDVSLGHAELNLGGMDYPAFNKTDLTLNTSNVFSYGPSNPNAVVMSVSTDTGLMQGSMKLTNPFPSPNFNSTLRGVVIEYPTYTREFFGFATSTSGTVPLYLHP